MDLLQDFIRPFMPKPSLVYPPRISAKGDHVNVISDLENALVPGDVTLFRVFDKKDFLGNVITHITDSPYSHAEMHLEHGYAISADAGGIGYVDLLHQTSHLDLFRLNRPILDEEMEILKAKAASVLNFPYNYFNLLNFDYISQEDAIKLSGGKSFICSQLVSWLFQQIQVQLVVGAPTALQAPADLGRSSILNYVGTFVYGQRVEGDWRNKPLEFHENQFADFIANFMDLFSKKDEFYADLAKYNSFLVGKD